MILHWNFCTTFPFISLNNYWWQRFLGNMDRDLSTLRQINQNELKHSIFRTTPLLFEISRSKIYILINNVLWRRQTNPTYISTWDNRHHNQIACYFDPYLDKALEMISIKYHVNIVNIRCYGIQWNYRKSDAIPKGKKRMKWRAICSNSSFGTTLSRPKLQFLDHIICHHLNIYFPDYHICKLLINKRRLSSTFHMLQYSNASLGR